MANITFTQLRNRRLRNECRNLMERDNVGHPSKVIDELLSTPVPYGYFVGHSHAMEMDRKHRAGTLPPLTPAKKEMWEAFFNAVDIIQKKRKLTRVDAVCYVVAKGTAPRFYLSRDEALRICRHVRPDNEEEDGELW